ncbi:hypothetical protein JHK86_010012 [Glycine max]|nr:hypothetical protein JHK86_010012 [Glycine max]
MSLLVETMRSKLEDTRQKLVASDNKVRQLETQVHEKKLTIGNEMKKVELERQETRRLRKEIESNKVDMRLAMKELDHIPCKKHLRKYAL